MYTSMPPKSYYGNEIFCNLSTAIAMQLRWDIIWMPPKYADDEAMKENNER